MRNLTILLLTLSLTGCIAVWGKSYNVDAATPDYIQVNYDDSVINYPLMLQEVRSHCARYDKVARNDTTIRNYWGITMSIYLCEEPS